MKYDRGDSFTFRFLNQIEYQFWVKIERKKVIHDYMLDFETKCTYIFSESEKLCFHFDVKFDSRIFRRGNFCRGTDCRGTD